jgi:hypothetical protein
MYQREGEREHAGAGERLDATNKMGGWMGRNENTFHISSRRVKVSGSNHQRRYEKIKRKIKCEDGKCLVMGFT